MENIRINSKIRIVLIDDEPSNGLKDGGELRVHKKTYIENFNGIDELFELLWLRTTEDVKRFLDSIQHCEFHSTIGLINGGLIIPEIICFDYSLDKGRSNAELFSENYLLNPFREIESFILKSFKLSFFIKTSS